MSETFDANRKFCDYALWIDDSAAWINRIAESGEAKRGTGQVVLVIDKTELTIFDT